MNIGNYEVYLASSGLFRLDGGAMFGVVPKVLWEKPHPSDEKNRILLCTNLLLLQGEGKQILVDTGNNAEAGEKMNMMYAIDHSTYSLKKFLSDRGLSAEDITDVILTHLHFDHAGGGVVKSSNNEFLPMFPNARYYVQKKQFEWACNPSRRDKASYRQEHFQSLYKAGQLTLLEGPGHPFPGIELLTFEGHTPGQQLPLISSNGETLFFAGDLIPLSSHVSLPWIMSYDLNSHTTLKEKESILRRAAEENWTIIFEHDPVRQTGAVEMRNGEFAIKE